MSIQEHKIKTEGLELNGEFLRAYELMEQTDKNIFVTGKAGTGKSTLLQYFRENTAKKVVVLAPTGVAAINVKGQTIHSFFKFKPDITWSKVKKLKDGGKDEIYKKLDAILIDEISMVRADLLDCVDRFMRLNGRDPFKPFGGAQMIFIGDLYQLPPVLTNNEKEAFRQNYNGPYFFDSHVFQEGKDSLYGREFQFELIELENIYRQKDPRFIAILNAIRNNTVTQQDLDDLNSRYQPDIERDLEDYYIFITTTNQKALRINEYKLGLLPGKAHCYHGVITGNFDHRYLPTDTDLTLKTGSQVMMLNNDAEGRWVNGSVGRITDILSSGDDDPDLILAELSNGEIVEISPHTWDVYSFEFDPHSNTVFSTSVGSFTQYPLKLAWAITIHKSQGKTFDKVIIDLSGGTFAHGQSYVALSRCTTMEGMLLKSPVRMGHIIMDDRVIDFVTRHQYEQAEKLLPLESKVSLIEEAISQKAPLEITYLKNTDIKSKRTIHPHTVGTMEYMDSEFLGVSGFCTARNEDRTFRVDRILELRLAE